MLFNDLDIPLPNTDYYVRSGIVEPQEAKKIFVGNLPKELTNDNVEKLLKECGQLVSFQRSKGVGFGYAIFENLESVLKCMRLLKGLSLNSQEIKVNGGEKSQIMIDSWLNRKEAEWDERRQTIGDKDKHKDENRALMRFVTFHDYITRDDDRIRRKLDKIIQELEGTVNKTKNEKKREEEKKEHQRERARDEKKAQYRNDLERKYQDKLREWNKKEEDRERERKREKDREIEREKNFDKLLEKELVYDRHTERKTIGKPKMIERKKFRQIEFEEDELFRKKELLKSQKPPEPEPPQQVTIDEEEQPQEQAQEEDEQFQQIEKPKEIDLKEEYHKIYVAIDKERDELFEIPINWQLFAQSNLLEKKVRPWLRDRCIEYLTQEEKAFIDAIVKRLFNREKPQTIINKVVKKVLDEDSEQFVIRMWKMILFELMKLERGLP